MIAENNFKQRIQKKTNTLLNQSNTPIQEGHMIFAKAFIRNLVQEAEELDGVSPVAEFTPEKNKEDFTASLDQGTDPNGFDIDGVPAEITGEDLSKLKEFVEKLNSFADFLNDYESGQSVHSVLSNSDKNGSILKGVSRKASDSITRIASEVSKLQQVLASFVIEAPRKLRDASQNQIGAVQ